MFPTLSYADPVDKGQSAPLTTKVAQVKDYKIEVNKKTNKLYLYTNGVVTKVYPVATGRSAELTPEGTFPMVVKIVKPGWKNIPGGDPKNPLGPRWNGLEVKGDRGRTYGIHGNNNPSSIGTNASSGCIRMHNNDVIELFNTIYEGTPVWIHSGSSDNKWRGNSQIGIKKQSGVVNVPRSKVKAWTGPSIGSFVTTSINKNTKLTKTGVSGSWVQVQLPNLKVAFIQENFLKKAEKSTVIVDVDLANIRSKPSTTASIIQKQKYGTILHYTGKPVGFYQLKLSNGKVGYISNSIVKE